MAEMSWSEAERICLLLDLVENAWQELPRVVTEKQEDPIDYDVFAAEWPLQQTRNDLLERYRAQGRMTTEQLARHERLRALMERNRPYVHQLLGDAYTQDESKRRDVA